jgi:predicted metalloprotease with PDZ domain
VCNNESWLALFSENSFMGNRILSLLFFAVLLFHFLPAAAHAQDARKPVRLAVDLRDATKHIFHAKLSFPAAAGPLTLVYPKWIPGEHSPIGPIVNLTGVKFRASGKEIDWRRDDVDMFAFHCQIPSGVNELEVSMDYVSPSGPTAGRENPSATAQLAILNWYTVLLYPQGARSDDLTYSASLQVPSGWKFGTALPIASETGGIIEFQPASLTTLIDSPVLMGAHMRTIDLSPGQKPEHHIHIAAETESGLEVTPETIQEWRQLVAETGAIFGARHYRHYDFLLAESDNVETDGVEHHESSDNRVPARTFQDPNISDAMTDLLPHEFTHSWNGKYRRPAGLATPNYQEPMKGGLLWVYEGMTQYYGTILSARIGSWTPDRLRENLAWVAAYLDQRKGRSWRDLEDTVVAAQLLYGSPEEYKSWRRDTDYYDEGTLLWLEADTIIRQETKGKKSLDDFCRKFEGGESTGPKIVPYTFDDVVAAMQEVAPYDWKGFFTERVKSHGPGAPLGGIENGGWKLVYTETPNESRAATEAATHLTDVQFSLGFIVRDSGGENGDEVSDVIPGSPAALAGLAPGMKLVAVNGRRWNSEDLHAAIRQAASGHEPIELLIENEDFFQTYKVDYHGGERYPHLERIGGKPDLLGEITKMKAAPIPSPKPGGN